MAIVVEKVENIARRMLFIFWPEFVSFSAVENIGI